MKIIHHVSGKGRYFIHEHIRFEDDYINILSLYIDDIYKKSCCFFEEKEVRSVYTWFSCKEYIILRTSSNKPNEFKRDG